MFKFIKRVVRAPLSYLADLRQLSFRQYLMLHNKFSPSYPIMIFTSLLSTLSLAAFIIYFIITTPAASECFNNVRGGAYVVSVLYPIQTILCFICLTATIALAKNSCWKITWIVLFGPVLCGFGYGEIGLIEMCVLGSQDQQSFKVVSLIRQPSFIAAMIYLYITVVALYFILVPSIEYLYKRQKEDQAKVLQQKKIVQETKSAGKQQQKTLNNDAQVQQIPQNPNQSCCGRFICLLYYLLHVIFFFSVLFILVFKILGPILFTYIWIEMASNRDNFLLTPQKVLFALSLIAYFSPIVAILMTLFTQAIAKLMRKKPELQEQIPEIKDRQTIQISQGQEKTSKLETQELRNQQKPAISVKNQEQNQLPSKIQRGLNPGQQQSSISKKERKQSLI